MPANPVAWANLAKIDPSTGSVEHYQNLAPREYYWYTQIASDITPMLDGSNDVLVRTSWSSYTCLSRIDENGSGKWHLDDIFDIGWTVRTFGYDNVNNIIVAMVNPVGGECRTLVGIDASDGSIIWTRNFPAYPTGPGIDSVTANGSKCIVVMRAFAGYLMRSIDTTTGSDIWTANSLFAQVVASAVDPSGDWLDCTPGGFNVHKRSGATGAILATATWFGVVAKCGPTEYMFADYSGCRVSSNSFGTIFNITSISGTTISSPLNCCRDSAGNYYFGIYPITLSGGAVVTFFKTNSSGSILWSTAWGNPAGYAGVQSCAIANDGYLWIGTASQLVN